jgi:hypothetical protein
MKKFIVFLVSVLLAVSISGTAFSTPIPFKVGTGGYLSETVTDGLGLIGSYTTLGTDPFSLEEGQTSSLINFFDITIPFSDAEGTIDAYIELITPDIDGHLTSRGTFKVFSFLFFSGGRLTWEKVSDPISYNYDGLTNGELLLTLNDIPKEWQLGTNFKISGTIKNVKNPVENPAAVPEPASIFLMGIGLLSLVGISRKKLIKKA